MRGGEGLRGGGATNALILEASCSARLAVALLMSYCQNDASSGGKVARPPLGTHHIHDASLVFETLISWQAFTVLFKLNFLHG